MMRVFLNDYVDMQNILIYGWNTSTWKDVLIASVIICTLTVIFEGLKTLKAYVVVRGKYNPLANGEEDESNGQGIEVTSSRADLLSSLRIPVSAQHTQRTRLLLFCLESLLHMFNFLYGYILMLLVMSYSIWFLLAVVMGSGIGFFIARPFEEHFTVKFSSPKTQTENNCYGGVFAHPIVPYSMSEEIHHY